MMGLDMAGVEELTEAAERGDAAAVRALLAAGADVDGRDARGRTAAMAATHGNRPEVFALLVEAGADIDLQDARSDNPFLYAGAEGLLEILEAAIAAGADTRRTNRYGGTALIPACHHGHVAAVRMLLERTDVAVDHVNRLGWTALLEAVILRDGDPAAEEIVALLLEHGADPSIADGDGVAALEHARRRGYGRIAGLLERARG